MAARGFRAFDHKVPRGWLGVRLSAIVITPRLLVIVRPVGAGRGAGAGLGFFGRCRVPTVISFRDGLRLLRWPCPCEQHEHPYRVLFVLFGRTWCTRRTNVRFVRFGSSDAHLPYKLSGRGNQAVRLQLVEPARKGDLSRPAAAFVVVVPIAVHAPVFVAGMG